MFYFEVRFNTKNEALAKSYIKNSIKTSEIISIQEDDYYICFDLKSPLSDDFIKDLKNRKEFYFVIHYGK